MTSRPVSHSLSATAIIGAFALAGCFEVENGPAFSGGDEVPGIQQTLYTVGQFSPSNNGVLHPVDPADVEVWSARRAVNGSYVLEQIEGDDDEEYMIVSPLRITAQDFVMEYSTEFDQTWLGILHVMGEGADRQFAFCIDLNWDDSAIAERAVAHNVSVDDESIGGVRLGSEDPGALFDLMADLWSRSTLNDWECSVLGTSPPEEPARRRKG